MFGNHLILARDSGCEVVCVVRWGRTGCSVIDSNHSILSALRFARLLFRFGSHAHESMPFFLVFLIGVCEQNLYKLAVVGINSIINDLSHFHGWPFPCLVSDQAELVP